MAHTKGTTMLNNFDVLNTYVGRQTDSIPFDDGDETWYIFPVSEEIPGGTYIAKIISVEKHFTSYRQEEFEVCFDIYEYYDVYRAKAASIKGVEYETEPPYYIRQKYIKGTDRYRRLVTALKCSSINASTWDDFIGSTFVSKLIYDKDYGTLRLYHEYDEELMEEEIRRNLYAV